MDEVNSLVSFEENGDAKLNGKIHISAFIFKSFTTSDDYKDENHWNTRLNIAMSNALESPDVYTQLCLYDYILQDCFRKDNLEKIISSGTLMKELIRFLPDEVNGYKCNNTDILVAEISRNNEVKKSLILDLDLYSLLNIENGVNSYNVNIAYNLVSKEEKSKGGYFRSLARLVEDKQNDI